jgi:hypothetical protein
MQSLTSAWLAFLVFSCSATAEQQVAVPGPRVDNGQTGSPSAQCVEKECAATAQDMAASFSEPRVAPNFVAASCQPPDQRQPTQHCRCDQAQGEPYRFSAVFDGCQLRGRGGLCLLSSREFQVCSLDTAAGGGSSGASSTDPNSCERTCALAQARLQMDAERKRTTAEVRFSGCVPPPPNSTLYTLPLCRMVLRVDDECFANNYEAWLNERPVNCGLPDQTLVAPWLDEAGSGGSSN